MFNVTPIAVPAADNQGAEKPVAKKPAAPAKEG
jgi:hypothetical protein